MVGNGVMNSFSVIFVALLSEFGLTRAELSGVFSVYIFVYFFASALVGPFLDRFGPRIVMPLGSLLIGLGLLCCSRISSPYQLYLFYGCITSLGACCVGWVPNTTIIANWFVRRRGMAVGIVMCGSGMSMFIFIPLTQLMIECIGWRGAFLTIALAVVIWLGPLNAIFQRTRPEDKGLAPNGVNYIPKKTTENPKRTAAEIKLEWTLSEAIRHRSFWMMCFAFFCNPFATFTILLHQVAFIIERGFEPMYVASALGFVGIFAMVGRFVGGTLSDSIGREMSYSLFMGAAALAVTFLFFLNQEYAWILTPYVVLVGLGMGVGGAMFPPIMADLFPGPNLSRIMGISSVFSGMGAGLGSWLAGYLYDITGNYVWGFFCVLIAILGAILFVWVAAPRRTKVLL